MQSDATTVATFTNIANWQGVDTEPKSGSKNLIESGGVLMSFGQLLLTDMIDSSYLAFENGILNINTGGESSSDIRIININAVSPKNLKIALPEGFVFTAVCYYSSWNSSTDFDYSIGFAFPQGKTEYAFDDTYNYVRFAIAKSDMTQPVTPNDLYNSLYLLKGELDSLEESVDSLEEGVALDELVDLIDYDGLEFESGTFNIGTGAEASSGNRIRNIGVLNTPLAIKVPNGFLIKFVLYYSSWDSPSSYTFAITDSPNSQYYKMGTRYPYARIVIAKSNDNVITPNDLYNALPLVTNKTNEIESELDDKADASSLLDKSINIFDGEAIVGRMINGDIDASVTAYRTTKNLVPVEYGKTYYCTEKQASGIRRGIGRYVSFYDANGTLISQSSPSLDNQKFTVENSNIKYIRWCWKPTDFGWSSSDADMEVMIYAGGVDATMITPDHTSAYVLYQAEYSPMGYLDYLPFLYQKKGVKVVSFGDSITDFGFYPEFACKMISAISYNVGFGGCRMAKTNNGNYEPFSMEALAESIVSGDFSAAHAAAESLSKQDWDEKITTLENLDFSTIKIITIEYGVNDFSASIPLNTVKAAVANIITTLKMAYKGLQIIFITPMYRRYGDNNEHDSDTYQNNNGDTLPDMVAAIKEVARENHIECLDLYYTMGVNAQSWQYYLQDGTHPTYNGYREIGRRLGGYLLTH